MELHWTLMYSFMGNELHFDLPEGHFDPIDDQVVEPGFQRNN